MTVVIVACIGYITIVILLLPFLLLCLPFDPFALLARAQFIDPNPNPGSRLYRLLVVAYSYDGGTTVT